MGGKKFNMTFLTAKKKRDLFGIWGGFWASKPPVTPLPLLEFLGCGLVPGWEARPHCHGGQVPCGPAGEGRGGAGATGQSRPGPGDSRSLPPGSGWDDCPLTQHKDGKDGRLPGHGTCPELDFPRGNDAKCSKEAGSALKAALKDNAARGQSQLWAWPAES